MSEDPVSEDIEIICDLCGIYGHEWFTWLTEDPTGEQRFEDPEWLVCSDCHPLVLSGSRLGLLIRAEQSPLVEMRKSELMHGQGYLPRAAIHEIQTDISTVHGIFFKHKTSWWPGKERRQ